VSKATLVPLGRHTNLAKVSEQQAAKVGQVELVQVLVLGMGQVRRKT